MTGGNFGLWYNKFIPISNFDACKASDERGDKDNAVKYYHDKYKQFQKDTINKILDKKHLDQSDFCSILSPQYEIVIFKAKLKTPLITGIGETHPHEVSMVFDHNMGIPYIPASGIKGIVRFTHTLDLIDKIPDGKLVIRDKDGKPCPPHFNDEEDWTNIPTLFGTQAQRGSVVFLDAYPENVPDLHIDIMNPHYGDYYSDDKNKTPPADYLNPVPIKFLTVAKDTVFVFRALVDKGQSELIDRAKAAFKKALTEEGVGAKTAVGYGRFEIMNIEGLDSVRLAGESSTSAKPQQKTDTQGKTLVMQCPIQQFIEEVKKCRRDDAGRIGSIIDNALAQLETVEEKSKFSSAVREHMGKAFKKSKARAKLEPFLKE